MSDGNAPPSNVGTYLARRLINIGIREFYAVPGKSNVCDCLGHLGWSLGSRRGGLMSRKDGGWKKE